MVDDGQPDLFQRLLRAAKSIFVVEDDPVADVYEGDFCPHCHARLAYLEVEHKGEAVAKNKSCPMCLWRPGEEPERTPAEAREVARRRAELADEMVTEMENHAR